VFFFWQPFSIGATTASQQQEQTAKQVIFFSCHAAIPYELTHGHNLASSPPAVQSREIEQDIFVEQHFCPHKSVWLSILYAMILYACLLTICGNLVLMW